jgi:predicted ester cyclase
MSNEQNKTLVRSFWGSFNQERDDQIDRYYAPEIVCYMGINEPLRGIEVNKQNLAGFRAGFSNIRFTVQDMLAEGDKVTARLTFSMKHTSEFQGIPPTGTEVMGSTIEICRIANGRIVEQWTEMDNLSFMTQLGAISLPG